MSSMFLFPLTGRLPSLQETHGQLYEDVLQRKDGQFMGAASSFFLPPSGPSKLLVVHFCGSGESSTDAVDWSCFHASHGHGAYLVNYCFNAEGSKQQPSTAAFQQDAEAAVDATVLRLSAATVRHSVVLSGRSIGSSVAIAAACYWLARYPEAAGCLHRVVVDVGYCRFSEVMADIEQEDYGTPLTRSASRWAASGELTAYDLNNDRGPELLRSVPIVQVVRSDDKLILPARQRRFTIMYEQHPHFLVVCLPVTHNQHLTNYDELLTMPWENLRTYQGRTAQGVVSTVVSDGASHSFQHKLLSDSFHADVAACHGSPADATRWYDRLVQHYTEPQRHYHTLQHLISMLQHAQQHHHHIPNPLSLRLAIYFHDIIYDPQRKDNEAESVVVFNAFVDDIHIDPILAATVRHYILCTVSHTVPVDSSGDETLLWFLDLDLDVLSRSSDEYDVYAEQIALEYGHLERDVYRAGRCAVLQKFLQREVLYFTAEFRDVHEAQARRNLEREIATLSSSTQAVK